MAPTPRTMSEPLNVVVTIMLVEPTATIGAICHALRPIGSDHAPFLVGQRLD